MEINHSTGNKMPSQEHLNFINKLNDAKIPRQSQLIANRLFMKNFPRETTGAEIENCFQTFGPVHDVKIIAKENTHFAFISFVNDTTALDVLRQHAIVPITFQNRPIILAPAYKKTNPSSTSPTSYYPANGSTMTPPPTPSRSANNGISRQPSTPYHQQGLSAPQPVYPPIFLPLHQANMPFLPMTGTYLVPQGAPPPQLPPSFYPAFYTHGTTHQTGGQLINGHAYVPSPYMYSMGPPPIPGQYQAMTSTNDVSMTSEY
jgi:RNA recognition motif-containing protein